MLPRILLVFWLACLAVDAALADPQPLLMPGKRSLYQRMLATPGSRLYPEPQQSGATRDVIPFTGYYVYQRQKASGEEWVQVGSDSHGTVLGWIPASALIPWNQALTVAFKDPKKGGRVLLFRDRPSLKHLVEAYDLKTYERLYEEAVSGKLSKDSPVVAIQPGTPIDIQENFYLVPIKQHEDIYLGSEKARLLEVASVPLSGAATAPRSYRSGIVFVIDTTQSMRPYIDRTREVMRRIFEAIDKAGLREQVSFGLTAFRDTPGEADGGYLSRTFATLKEGSDPQSFFRQVEGVQPAAISNQDFIEDAFAGIKSAIDGNDWRGFDARYLILVTDASARTAEDPFSSTKLDAKSLRLLAAEQGIAILTLHLRTAMGAEDHARAERQYRELSYYPGIGDLYYGVKMGEVGEFGRVLEALTRQVTGQVEAAVKGRPLTLGVQAQSTPRRDELVGLQEKVGKLGFALQMRYLQKKKGALPAVFDAWLVDRDFRDPSQASIEVRVLLTRDQLSDLRNVLQQVLDLAEEGVISPHNFLNEIKRLAAMLSRDPASVRSKTKGTGSNLAEMGYMREYLEDLPYTSDVMNLSLEDWAHWSAKQQLEFIHHLENKITYYQGLHDHIDLWISLGGGPVTGDSVFPVLLEMLP